MPPRPTTTNGRTTTAQPTMDVYSVDGLRCYTVPRCAISHRGLTADRTTSSNSNAASPSSPAGGVSTPQTPATTNSGSNNNSNNGPTVCRVHCDAVEREKDGSKRPWNAASPCPLGAKCPNVHIDVPLSGLRSEAVHLHYIWRDETCVTYEKLTQPMTRDHPEMTREEVASTLLEVYGPNNREPFEMIPAVRVLHTRGARYAFDAAIGAPNRTPSTSRPCHCAHYYFNQICNRGASCAFIHVVSVDDRQKEPCHKATNYHRRIAILAGDASIANSAASPPTAAHNTVNSLNNTTNNGSSAGNTTTTANEAMNVSPNTPQQSNGGGLNHHHHQQQQRNSPSLNANIAGAIGGLGAMSSPTPTLNPRTNPSNTTTPGTNRSSNGGFHSNGCSYNGANNNSANGGTTPLLAATTSMPRTSMATSAAAVGNGGGAFNNTPSIGINITASNMMMAASPSTAPAPTASLNLNMSAARSPSRGMTSDDVPPPPPPEAFIAVNRTSTATSPSTQMQHHHQPSMMNMPPLPPTTTTTGGLTRGNSASASCEGSPFPRVVVGGVPMPSTVNGCVPFPPNATVLMNQQQQRPSSLNNNNTHVGFPAPPPPPPFVTNRAGSGNAMTLPAGDMDFEEEAAAAQQEGGAMDYYCDTNTNNSSHMMDHHYQHEHPGQQQYQHQRQHSSNGGHFSNEGGAAGFTTKTSPPRQQRTPSNNNSYHSGNGRVGQTPSQQQQNHFGGMSAEDVWEPTTTTTAPHNNGSGVTVGMVGPSVVVKVGGHVQRFPPATATVDPMLMQGGNNGNGTSHHFTPRQQQHQHTTPQPMHPNNNFNGISTGPCGNSMMAPEDLQRRTAGSSNNNCGGGAPYGSPKMNSGSHTNSPATSMMTPMMSAKVPQGRFTHQPYTPPSTMHQYGNGPSSMTPPTAMRL